MFRIALVALISTLVGLTSCASVRPVTASKDFETQETVAQRELLIGTWQGTAPIAGGGTRTWTTRRDVDGTFRVDFTNSGVAGVPITQSEIGIWGISGGIYFTAIRGFVDPSGIAEAETDDPALYDTYKVLVLNTEMFEYQNLSTGNRFLVRRIPATSGAP